MSVQHNVRLDDADPSVVYDPPPCSGCSSGWRRVEYDAAFNRTLTSTDQVGAHLTFSCEECYRLTVWCVVPGGSDTEQGGSWTILIDGDTAAPHTYASPPNNVTRSGTRLCFDTGGIPNGPHQLSLTTREQGRLTLIDYVEFVTKATNAISAIASAQSSAIASAQSSAIASAQSSVIDIASAQSSAIQSAQSSVIADAQSSAIANAQSSAIANAQSSAIANAQSSAIRSAQSNAIASAQSSAIPSSTTSPIGVAATAGDSETPLSKHHGSVALPNGAFAPLIIVLALLLGLFLVLYIRMRRDASDKAPAKHIPVFKPQTSEQPSERDNMRSTSPADHSSHALSATLAHRRVTSWQTRTLPEPAPRSGRSFMDSSLSGEDDAPPAY